MSKSVFLRWGIFGIIGFAAVMYAYNVSKRLAERRSVREAPAVTAPAADLASEPESAPVPVLEDKLEPHCQAELEVAQRALEARRQGEPIDRLLRIQEIAFQEQPRRQRLETVATRWYRLKGEEPLPDALSLSVNDDCIRFSPAP